MTETIIFFDGECMLCNSSVNFIIKHDKNSQFMFSPLQGKKAAELNIYSADKTPDSIILIEKGNIYKFSDAALRIASKLDGFWKMLYVFIIIPRFLRDFVYKFIAKHRYKWFGKYDYCMVPNDNIKKRFLE